jgi:DNA-binding MarR family transcriptional regulator
MQRVSPEADDPAFALERFTPFRLSVLSSRMTRAVANVYTKPFKLSAPEWRTMAVLGRFGAMNANTVVERTAMDKVRVSRTVTRLLRSGHITRRTDPRDRRRAILDVTAKGLAVYRQIVPRALAVEATLLQDLTDSERTAFEAAVAKLEARVGTVVIEPED